MELTDQIIWVPITDGVTQPLAGWEIPAQSENSSVAAPSDLPLTIATPAVSSPAPDSDSGDMPGLLTPLTEDDQNNQAGAGVDAPQPLPTWPGNSATVADLLTLCSRSRTEPLVTVWADLFGEEYTYSPGTAHRYVIWGQRFLEDEAAGRWAAAHLDRSIAHARMNDRATFNMMTGGHFAPAGAASLE